MVRRIIEQTYLWILLILLYAPILIIVVYSFTEAKVLGNWTGFSFKLYESLMNTGAHHSLMNACSIRSPLLSLLLRFLLFGKYCSYWNIQLAGSQPESCRIYQYDSYLKRGYHYGYIAVPAVCFFGSNTGIYNCCAGSYYFLYAIRCFERSASFEADEPEYL